ncbi:MAG TPA: S-adenosylmethionine:tRNA ribosyltransferase-isomerase [Solirubrobacteraceae bacterium]
MTALRFELPARLEAGAPPPERDAVRLLVAHRGRPLVHAGFRALPEHLSPGDLLVVNASATIPAALPARRDDGTAVSLHLSTPEPPRKTATVAAGAENGGAGEAAAMAAGAEDGGGGKAAAVAAGDEGARWVVELRRGGERARDGRAGERLTLPGGASAELLAPYLSVDRLWVAALDLPAPLPEYLRRHGAPIRYRHLTEARPLDDFQTIFATEPGSAEMPSAARPFTRRVLAALRARRVGVAALVLHTGVSSLERGERPYPERFRVPPSTAERVNVTHAAGRRVIAVGTTVARALETTAQDDGTVEPAAGWTSLVITPERGVRTLDGLLTGWHEPAASHLLLLEAVGGRALIERSYSAALAHGYRWHEFGDSHLILR